MSNRHDDIDDNEIRVILSRVKPPSGGKQRRSRTGLYVAAAIAVMAVAAVALFLYFGRGDGREAPVTAVPAPPPPAEQAEEKPAVHDEKGFAVRTDTVINGAELAFLFPRSAVPSLEIGSAEERDSTVVLMAQAADVRGDNGMIAGSCVINGELVSKGEAKAGFCAIIGDEVTVGVAEATPSFEKALQTGGSFFRQYPLVVGGQIVENRPKGRAIRKALAELNGEICVIISFTPLTFHDFSQALVDAGVRNAIYLVGGKSYGSYTDAAGETFTFGQKWEKDYRNVNYIVWRTRRSAP